jgi:hypothetical protein
VEDDGSERRVPPSDRRQADRARRGPEPIGAAARA